MYDLPPRRRISLILVKLGPAHRRQHLDYGWLSKANLRGPASASADSSFLKANSPDGDAVAQAEPPGDTPVVDLSKRTFLGWGAGAFRQRLHVRVYRFILIFVDFLVS